MECPTRLSLPECRRSRSTPDARCCRDSENLDNQADRSGAGSRSLRRDRLNRVRRSFFAFADAPEKLRVVFPQSIRAPRVCAQTFRARRRSTDGATSTPHNPYPQRRVLLLLATAAHVPDFVTANRSSRCRRSVFVPREYLRQEDWYSHLGMASIVNPRSGPSADDLFLLASCDPGCANRLRRALP